MGSGFDSVSSAANFVKDVAQQSYGSRLGEGTSGGAGAIGLIGDKVVKFNTHRSERKGTVTADMLRTSDQLRMMLGGAAEKLAETKPGQTRADQKYYLQKIYKELGLSDEGFLPAEGGKSLLSRKVTAKVVKMIDQMRLSSGAGQVDSFNTWSVRSSRNKDTSFESVKAETEKSVAREEASAQSAKADAARNQLLGNNIKGSLKPDLAKSIAKQLLSMPSKYVSKEMHEKINELVTKLLDKGVSPNKAVRLAYLLTEGLEKARKAYLEKNGFTDEPQDPSKGLKAAQWFFRGTDAKKAAMRTYEKQMAEYTAKSTEVANAFSSVIKANASKVANLAAMDENAIDCMMDVMMVGAQNNVDKICPGLFDETTGKGLQKLDGLLAHCIQKANAKPALEQVPVSAMLKVDVDKVMAKTKNVVQGLIKDIATFEDLSVESDPGDPSVARVKFKGLKFTEKLPRALDNADFVGHDVLANVIRNNNFDDFAIPLKFGFDADTGKMEVSVGWLESKSAPDVAKSINLILKDTVKLHQMIFDALAGSPLGTETTIEGRDGASLDGLDKIAELNDKTMLPMEFSKSAEKEVSHFDLKIDPSKFTPFESLGLPPGSKVTGFEMKDGIMSVQVGGEAGEVKNLSDVKGGVAAQVSVGKPQLKMMTDEVAKLMREKGIGLGDLKITTSEKTGTIRLDITDMDASGFLKGIPGAAATGVRLFQKGSYGITFRPQVDQKTGTMVLALQEVESKTNPNKVAVLNLGAKVATAFAKVVFGGSSDFKVEKPTTRKPGEKPYMTQIRMTPEGLSKLLPKLDGKSQPSIRPDNLKVTDEGLTFGMTGKI